MTAIGATTTITGMSTNHDSSALPLAEGLMPHLLLREARFDAAVLRVATLSSVCSHPCEPYTEMLATPEMAGSGAAFWVSAVRPPQAAAAPIPPTTTDGNTKSTSGTGPSRNRTRTWWKRTKRVGRRGGYYRPIRS